MKNLKLLAIILVIGIIAVSCKKEEGPAGPAGAAGTNGTNGNANVTVYGFPSVTYTSLSANHTFILPISFGMVDSSMIIPYYKTAAVWYAAGEIGLDVDYLTRYYLEILTSTSTNLNIKMMNTDATAYTGADQIWDSVRVFVIPANIFKSTPMGKVNFNDYKSVSSYYDVK
jgi:hypothetical protein